MNSRGEAGWGDKVSVLMLLSMLTICTFQIAAPVSWDFTPRVGYLGNSEPFSDYRAAVDVIRGPDRAIDF